MSVNISFLHFQNDPRPPAKEEHRSCKAQYWPGAHAATDATTEAIYWADTKSCGQGYAPSRPLSHRAKLIRTYSPATSPTIQDNSSTIWLRPLTTSLGRRWYAIK